MNGWPELVEVLTGYWDSQRMVVLFGTTEINLTLEEIRDCIDTVGTGIERKARKQEDIFIPNKPSVEDIADWFGLGKNFAYSFQESHIAFRDLYIKFGHASFYATYNREFKVSYKEWNEIHPLAFAVALLGTMVFPYGPSLSINIRVITPAHTLFKGYENQGTMKYYPIAPVILSDMYRALGKCKEGHRYLQGCNLLLQWWILSHLAKGAGSQKLHTLYNKNTLKDLNDMLYWANMDNRRTRGRWAQIFSELREEDLQWMLDRFISKEVAVESRRQLVLPLPSIRGICPYAPFRVLRQFGRRQTVPEEAYYGSYVYDIGDDRVHDASEMFREWKNAKQMDKTNIAPDRFNAGYDEGYKKWLKKDIQSIFSPTPRSFHSVTGKEAKAVAELQEVKKKAQEVYAKYVENQDTLEKMTQEVERLRCGYDDFDTWVEDKIKKMRYESLEYKGHLGEGFLLMLRCMYQQYNTQGNNNGAGPSRTT